MISLTRTEWLVLNSTADDCEDLERIYKVVAFEYVWGRENPSSPIIGVWRPISNAPSLAEIADSIRGLVDKGLLNIIMDQNGRNRWPPEDLSYVWKGWFQMTDEARALVESTASQFMD
jgi:hypothetical protein